MFSLTLAVVTGVAILLPGFFAILLWNTRARRFAVGRPDLPINALSVLAIGVAVSLIAHLVTGLGIGLVQALLVDVSRFLPAQYRSPAVNPIGTLLIIAQGGPKAAALSAGNLVWGICTDLLDVRGGRVPGGGVAQR